MVNYFKPLKWYLDYLLNAHSFVKVSRPRPGDSEVTFSVFESNCNLLLPV